MKRPYKNKLAMLAPWANCIAALLSRYSCFSYLCCRQVYDDAQWLTGGGREDLRVAHADLPHSVAERLGLKSLRYMLLVDTELASSLVCPGAPMLAHLLKSYRFQPSPTLPARSKNCTAHTSIESGLGYLFYLWAKLAAVDA